MFAWRAFPSRGDAPTGPTGVQPAPPAGPAPFLTVPSLASVGIGVAFTTRRGGVSPAPFASLNLSLASGDDPDHVRANRGRVLAGLGCAPGDWTAGHQVHEATVATVTTADRGCGAVEHGTALPGTDALVTAEPGVPIAVLTADCVPILLADPGGRRIGVVHAGWRGLVAGVIEAAVQAMGTDDLRAYIGPAIGPCCYEVGGDVADEVGERVGGEAVRAGAERPHVDLWRGARVALGRAGVRAVWPSMVCTRCEPHRFFSHRAGDAGRQGLIAVIHP